MLKISKPKSINYKLFQNITTEINATMNTFVGEASGRFTIMH